MSFLKRAYKFLTAEHTLIILAVIVAAIFLMQYSSLKSKLVGGMTNGVGLSMSDDDRHQASANPPLAASSLASESTPGPAVGGPPIISGNASCLNKAAANPGDLLPKSNNAAWNDLNPSGGGDLNNVNLLKAGHLAGMDTVGSSLRNANLQIRSEPANPKSLVSPWMNTTIEPDLMRSPLEIGCGPKVCDR